MAFVEPTFPEFTVKDRHGAEAYAKITHDSILNIAKHNKGAGSVVTFLDDKTMKAVNNFYSTIVSGPDSNAETVAKILAVIAKSRADRKKAEAAKSLAAKAGSGAAGTGKHAGKTAADFERDSKARTNNYVEEDDYEDYDGEYYEEEEEEEVAPVAPQLSAAEVLKQQEAAKKAAAAAIVMPKKTGGAKVLRL